MKLSKARKIVKEELELTLLKDSKLVIDTASEVLSRQVSLSPSKKDQIRLTRLISWAEKYSISLNEVLSVLLKVWMGKFVKHNTKGLGVAIGTLTGIRSKEILKNYISKAYKNKENITLARQFLLDKILPVSQNVEFIDPLDFISEYKDHIAALRERDLTISTKLKRRKWRNSPFIK